MSSACLEACPDVVRRGLCALVAEEQRMLAYHAPHRRAFAPGVTERARRAVQHGEPLTENHYPVPEGGGPVALNSRCRRERAPSRAASRRAEPTPV